MSTITFFTRTSTADKNALVPIYVRLRHGRNIDLVSKADILIKPENWSNHAQKANQRADAFKFYDGESKDEQKGRQKFNDKISGLRAHLESELMKSHKGDIISKSQGIISEGAKRRKEVSKWLDEAIDRYWHPDKYKTTLFSFIQSYIDKAQTKPNPKTGRTISYKMRREYEVSFGYLKKYSQSLKKEIDFKDIDLDFYDGYTQFLQNTVLPSKNPEVKQKLAVNTVGEKIQTLKIFLNAAKEEGKNPFDMYRSRKFIAMTEESETIYLNEEELKKIYEHDFSKDPVKEQTRDLFLVGCWTGCRFSDISQITPENVSEGFIHMKQYKTGKRVLIPLHSVVTAILSKYHGRLPDVTTNQQFNRTLKEIAEDSGIKEMTHKAITRGGVKVSKSYPKFKLVTTHSARRSFATNLYKSGFPSISIMAITGHVTEKSFLKYIKVTPSEHARKLQDFWGNKHLKVVG